MLTREEFRKGYALLTSDTARAAAERQKIEEAVAAERVRATKEAALVLAEAELMDLLSKPSTGKEPPTASSSSSSSGRGPPLRAWSSEPYMRYGPLPVGFEAKRAQELVEQRCAAKATGDYKKADTIQGKLQRMGVRLDDRWRTWSCEVTLSLAKNNHKRQARSEKLDGKVVPTAQAKGGRPQPERTRPPRRAVQ